MTVGERSRYHSLDAMRGLAALLVGVFHYSHPTAPCGFLAVDFFFALSGFVLARAYGARLAAGSVGRFMEMRFVRLYPLYLAGSGLGFLHAVQGTMRGADLHLAWSELVTAGVFAVTMLPDALGVELYPLNGVFWSIAAELAVNLLFAAVLVKCSTRVVTAILVVAAVALAWLLLSTGITNGGERWAGLPFLMTRTAFSFTVGVWLARIIREERRPITAWMCVPLLILCAILLAGADASVSPAYVLLATVVLFPLLLVTGALYDLPRPMVPVAAFLGDASYAFYACHAPIAHGFRFVFKSDRAAMVSIPLFLAVTLAVSAVLVHFWDKPARRWLNRRLSLRRSAVPQVL